MIMGISRRVSCELVLATDCKSVYDCIKKEGSTPDMWAGSC